MNWENGIETCKISYINGYMEITVQFSSVSQLCLTLCNPMACSTPGFLVFYYFQEFAGRGLGVVM